MVSPYVYAGLAMRKATSLEDILSLCAHRSGISVEDLKIRSRRRELVIVRQLYCYLAREKTEHSLEKIGELISRDHATVHYAVNQCARWIEVNDKEFMYYYKKIVE